jgi:hypothetical protein
MATILRFLGGIIVLLTLAGGYYAFQGLGVYHGVSEVAKVGYGLSVLLIAGSCVGGILIGTLAGAVGEMTASLSEIRQLLEHQARQDDEFRRRRIEPTL